MTRNTKSKKNKNMPAEIENKNQETKIQETKRRGRPKTKTEDDRQVNVRIPLSVIAQWEEIQLVYGGNFTRYINKLIVEDLERNKQLYADIIEMLK